jgi:hypothetical protein
MHSLEIGFSTEQPRSAPNGIYFAADEVGNAIAFGGIVFDDLIADFVVEDASHDGSIFDADGLLSESVIQLRVQKLHSVPFEIEFVFIE